MTEIKNRNIFKVYLFFILLIAIFIFNNFVEKAKGQSGIGIELQVFTDPKWNDLGSATSAGTSTLDTSNNDNFYLFYNQDPKITVVAGTFYRLKLKNATSNFSLIFNRYFPSSTSYTFRNLDCDSVGGKIEGNDCIIEGMFTTTTNTNEDHERWIISLIKNNSSSTIYFYLVPSSTAKGNVAKRSDQYYIIPRIAYATITDSNPSTSITYSIYYRKLYCPNNLLAEGFLTSSPSSRGLNWNNYRVSRSDFEGGNIFTPRILNIFNPASGTYSISIEGMINNSRISYNAATLTVNNRITSPGGEQRDLRITCEAIFTISDQVYATYTISIDQNASGTPPYEYYINVYQTVNNELATSASRTNIPELSYQFPFTLLATGTYRATAIVKDSQSTTTQASCGNTICGCVYLYRSAAGITSGWYERCREREVWQLVYQTRDSNNFPYNDDRRNCICTRDSVDIRCRQP
jgi:hypothetical protein